MYDGSRATSWWPAQVADENTLSSSNKTSQENEYFSPDHGVFSSCVFSYSLAMLFLNSILSGSSKFPTGHKSRCLTSELSLIVNTMIISCVKRFEVYSYRKDPSFNGKKRFLDG
ncbi:hypothetical protein AKJ16_DCAP17573 [Drosera capensis]